MKSFALKIMALSLPVIIAFSVQECSSRNVPVPETTVREPETSKIIIYDPDDPNNPANQGNTAAPEFPDGEETTNGDVQVSAVPTDTAGIVDYYNTALGKTSSLKRTSFTRTLTKCVVSPGVGDRTDDADVQRLANINDTSSAASDLVSLDAAFVKSASARESGGDVILEIILNDVTSDKDIKKVEKGHVGVVTFDETVALVKTIAKEVFKLSTEIKKVNYYNLNSGKYTVTVDKETGRIKSVIHSFSESGEGKALVATVTLAIDIKAEYAA